MQLFHKIFIKCEQTALQMCGKIGQNAASVEDS